MRKFIVDGLLAGVIAAVIWILATDLVDMERTQVGLWGLILFAATAVVTMVIAGAVRGGRTHER